MNAHLVKRHPPIPDFRFEFSYLKSIGPYIQHHLPPRWTQQPNRHINESDEEGCASDDSSDAPAGDELVVRWRSVVWVTVRDQLMIPLIQGILWGVLRCCFPSALIAGNRAWRALKPHKEGSAVRWLRNWVQGLGFGER
ncbi:hypothetical protein AX15_000443 [Amanita polypyramis BW_CC]|nr:hypothetical protein AX15_000443 [Amanita polypyramis BW_CC]